MIHLTVMEVEKMYEWLDEADPPSYQAGDYFPTIKELKEKIFPFVEKAERDYSDDGRIKARNLIAYLCWLSQGGKDMEEGAAMLINNFVTPRMQEYYDFIDEIY